MNYTIIIAALVFSMIVNRASAQADYGEIRGKVLNEKTKTGYAKFSVLLKSKNGQLLSKTLSDSIGDFIFTRLDSGEYKLSVINKGYRSTHIVEVPVNKDEITFCNIVMRPLLKKNVPEDTTIVRKRVMITPDGPPGKHTNKLIK